MVFRDKELEQEVLLRRQSRTIFCPVGIRPPEREPRAATPRPELSETVGAELDFLWAAISERGRILDVEEFPPGIRERFRAARVSPARAVNFCLSDPSARDQLAAAAATRREDLLVHLALTLFPGAPRYTTLPRSIQRDVRAFFGSHATAMQEANAMLFSVGKPEAVQEGISSAVAAGLGGMRDDETFRMHVSVLNRLPASLRVLVGCAGVLRGGTEGADFVDIKLDGRRVAFIACLDATARLPVYAERTRIDLGRLRVSVDRPEGMILYLKGRFLPADAPELPEQRAFDEKLLKSRIASEDGKGPRYSELQEMLRQQRAKRGQSA